MTSSSVTRRTVGILIFDGVEVLDFAGPFEVFAGLMDEATGLPLFTVLTIAPEQGPVNSVGGLVVQPHYAVDHHPPLDILVVPGGHVQSLIDNVSAQSV